MVLIKADARFGGINDYKENTYGFARIFRGVLQIIMDVSEREKLSPEASLYYIQRCLPLGEFVRDDRPLRIDIRFETSELSEFLSQVKTSRKAFLFQVLETLLRLPTRSGFEAHGMFELASRQIPIMASQVIDIGGEHSTVSQPKSQPLVRAVKDTTQKEAAEVEQVAPKIKMRKKLEASTSKKPQRKRPVVTETEANIDTSTSQDTSVIEKFDSLSKRGRDVLAEVGQIVETNPLLSEFY